MKIGSKDFTESEVVAEIYALALEDAGVSVTRVFNLSSSVVPTSLNSGEVDLYPEYTGTAMLSIFKLKQTTTDAAKVARIVKNAYEKQGVATTLNYSPAADSQGIAIRTSIAKKYGIYTISQLQKQASKIRFASQGEFDERSDGLKGLATVYGKFNFKSSTVCDNSLKYKILSSGEADATPAYTTDGQLSDTSQFTVLKDNKKFWPPYNLVPVVRQDALTKNPKISAVINRISAKSPRKIS